MSNSVSFSFIFFNLSIIIIIIWRSEIKKKDEFSIWKNQNKIYLCQKSIVWWSKHWPIVWWILFERAKKKILKKLFHCHFVSNFALLFFCSGLKFPITKAKKWNEMKPLNRTHLIWFFFFWKKCFNSILDHKKIHNSKNFELFIEQQQQMKMKKGSDFVELLIQFILNFFFYKENRYCWPPSIQFFQFVLCNSKKKKIYVNRFFNIHSGHHQSGQSWIFKFQNFQSFFFFFQPKIWVWCIKIVKAWCGGGCDNPCLLK